MRDELDSVLRQWHTRHSPAEDRLQVLTRRITTAVAEDRYHGATVEMDPQLLWHERVRFAVIGAVVALLISSFHYEATYRPDPEPMGNGPAESFATIRPARYWSVRRLFRQFENQFADRLRWVSESRGYVGIGVADEGSRAGAGQPVIVRLVLVSSEADSGTWRPVWHTDVVMRSGEVAEVVPNKDQANHLKLLVYRRSDGQISVGTKLDLMAPVPIRSEQLLVLRENRPGEVLSFESGNQSYRVLQSVQPLNRAPSGS